MIPIYWLPFLAILPVLLYLALRRLRGAPQLTIVEVTTFLRKTDSGEFLRDLNPDIEEVLRHTFSRRNFLQSHRDNLHRIKERVSCMSHNALVFTHLANTELWRETKAHPGMENSERYIALGGELHRAAVELRVYALLTLARINFWLVLRTQWWFPFPAPRLSRLRSLGEINFYASYQRFKAAVAALCLEYGQEFYDEIVPLL